MNCSNIPKFIIIIKAFADILCQSVFHLLSVAKRTK